MTDNTPKTTAEEERLLGSCEFMVTAFVGMTLFAREFETENTALVADLGTANAIIDGLQFQVDLLQSKLASKGDVVAWMAPFKYDEDSSVKYALEHISDGKGYFLERLKSCNLHWIGDLVPLGIISESPSKPQISTALSPDEDLSYLIEQVNQQISEYEPEYRCGDPFEWAKHSCHLMKQLIALQSSEQDNMFSIDQLATACCEVGISDSDFQSIEISLSAITASTTTKGE